MYSMMYWYLTLYGGGEGSGLSQHFSDVKIIMLILMNSLSAQPMTDQPCIAEYD